MVGMGGVEVEGVVRQRTWWVETGAIALNFLQKLISSVLLLPAFNDNK